MQEWLAHPAVQGGLAPFAAGLAAAAVLARTRWLALAQVLGFAVAVTLAIGWSIEPLTSIRKLAIIGISTAVLCIAYEWARARSRAASAVAVSVLAVASAWMLWRLLVQKDMPDAIVAGVLAAAYVAWQAGTTLKVSADPVRGAAAGAMLGFAAGGLALLGASAVLGVVALGAGFAAAATLVVQALRNKAASAGRSISLPAAGIAALVGGAAVMSAELPWYTLLPTVAVAPATALSRSESPRTRGAVACLCSFVPVLAAIALAWFRPF